MLVKHCQTLAVWIVGFGLLCCSCSSGSPVAADDSPGSPESELGSGFNLALPVDRVFPGEVVDANGLIIPETSRTASLQHEQVMVKGSQILATMGNAVQQGAAMQLNYGDAGQGGLAAAIYRLPVGVSTPAIARIEISPCPRQEVGGGYAGESEFYIGVSDYQQGSWGWNGPYNDSFVALNIADIQVSQLGNTHLAVVACDGSQANVINITTRSTRDDLLEPPSVTGVDVQPAAGGSHISWTPTDSLNLAGYRVYASYQSFTPEQPQNAKSICDHLVQPPVLHLPEDAHDNWYYSVAAVDTAGNESAWTPVVSTAPGSAEVFDFSVLLDPPSALPGTERSLTFYIDSGPDGMQFNVDKDLDGYYEDQGVSPSGVSITPEHDGVSHIAVQVFSIDEPSRMALAKGAVWSGRELTVGPGMGYTRIEDAYTDAVEGDTIHVYHQAGEAPYSQPALFVDKANITFKGVYTPGESRVVLDGTGYEYSGVGSTPRAIFQFQPGANGCVVEGFELTGAHNTSHNGAGIRINQANDVTIRDCEIHGNDMGLMSNGNGTESTARNQVVEFCHVHHNGSLDDPGYNHNFYLGGTSVTIRGCEVNNSLTGHNIKSRARFNRIEWCYVHYSSNREFDLVDASGDTDYWGADSVIIGCLIIKDPACTGNKAVIHYGQDGGNDHKGTLWMVNNTIVTPYISPVVNTSAAGAGVNFYNNLIWDTDNNQTGQQLVGLSGSAEAIRISGSNNWLPYGMEVIAGTSISMGSIYVASQGENPPFTGGATPSMADNGWQLGSADPNITDAGKPWNDILLPSGAGQDPLDVPYAYRDQLWLAERPKATITTLGAFTLQF